VESHKNRETTIRIMVQERDKQQQAQALDWRQATLDQTRKEGSALVRSDPANDARIKRRQALDGHVTRDRMIRFGRGAGRRRRAFAIERELGAKLYVAILPGSSRISLRSWCSACLWRSSGQAK
jgi:hypothetical protein